MRENDYTLATISDTTTYVFELPEEYRTPVFSPNLWLKFINDGIVIAKFKLVDPSQRVVDDDVFHPDRATFVDENKIVLSRAPKDTEVGSEIVLDVVKYFPELTRTDDTAIGLVNNKQLITLGVAKNNTISDLTKVSLSPSFTQKYNNELTKALAANASSNELDDMRGDDYSNIGGIW